MRLIRKELHCVLPCLCYSLCFILFVSFSFKASLPESKKRKNKYDVVSALLLSLHPYRALLGAGLNRWGVLWRPNTENLACWTQKDVLYLGQQSFSPLKKCSWSLSRKINDHWSQHKPPGQRTTVSLQVAWAVKPSLRPFWVFRLHLCSAWTRSKDSCYCWSCFVQWSVLDVVFCLLINALW